MTMIDRIRGLFVATPKPKRRLRRARDNCMTDADVERFGENLQKLVDEGKFQPRDDL